MLGQLNNTKINLSSYDDRLSVSFRGLRAGWRIYRGLMRLEERLDRLRFVRHERALFELEQHGLSLSPSLS